jgi:S1-C subfamily serine protease
MRDLRQWRLIVPVLLIGAIGGVIVALLWGMRIVPDRSLPGIIAQWSPIVSVLTCNFRDRTGGVVGQQNGSGILSRRDGSYYVITNEHAFDLAGSGTSTLYDCIAQFPGDSALFSIPAADIVADASGADAGALLIRQPDPHLTALSSADHRGWCASAPHLGDAVLVLGYPWAAGEFTLTATEGIVSAVAADRYLTSAPIDTGSSGGAAIDVPNDCLIGMPTRVAPGTYENLGEILSWRSFQSEAQGAL